MYKGAPTHGGPRPQAVAVLVVVALGLLAGACSQPSSTGTVTSPSAANGRPQGGPVPTQLLGNWFLPAAIVTSVTGDSSCVLLKLTLAPTTYRLTHSENPACGKSSSGEVVVNNTEIDFFNADGCGLQLPDGVGRYAWTINSGVLRFSPLNQDPCPRGDAWLANRNYSRTNS